jgi:hypothetical protein
MWRSAIELDSDFLIGPCQPSGMQDPEPRVGNTIWCLSTLSSQQISIVPPIKPSRLQSVIVSSPLEGLPIAVVFYDELIKEDLFKFPSFTFQHLYLFQRLNSGWDYTQYRLPTKFTISPGINPSVFCHRRNPFFVKCHRSIPNHGDMPQEAISEGLQLLDEISLHPINSTNQLDSQIVSL